MQFTVEQIASYVGGEIVGDARAVVDSFAGINKAGRGALTFLGNASFEDCVYTTDAAAVLVPKNFVPKQETKAVLIKVDNPYLALTQLLTLYQQSLPKKKGISPLASIDPTVELGEDCYVEPFVVVGAGAKIGNRTQLLAHTTIGDGATVGDDCILYPSVSVYYGCKLGNRVIVHSGAVIGADGFGFAPAATGYQKIPQIGIVVVEDDVEIGANTCIDRSTMGATVVRKGVKMDNLVQVAHNVEVGSNTIMCSQVGVAGSTSIGEWCVFAGQAGIVGHAHIASHTTAGAKAGVAGPIKKEGQTVLGSPAIDGKRFARSNAVFRNLPEMRSELEELKRQVKELTERLSNNNE